eukprot:135635_1
MSTRIQAKVVLVFLHLNVFCGFAEEIICNQRTNCSNSQIECIHPHKTCNIKCISDMSCVNSSFICPKYANCNIIAISNYSLSNTIITCPSYSNQCNINIQCINNYSCFNTTFNGAHSTDFKINCNQSLSCINNNIFCPQYYNSNNMQSKQCHIHGELSHGIQIFAKNNWQHIDMNHSWSTNNNYKSLLYCGNNYQYHCFINYSIASKEWNCIDKSSNCDRNYGVTHTKSNKIDKNTLIIVLLVFSILHIVLLIICCFWWRKTQKYNPNVNVI